MTTSARGQKSGRQAASRGARKPAGRVSRSTGRRPAAAKAVTPPKVLSGAGRVLGGAKGLVADSSKLRVPIIVAVVILVVLVTLYSPAKDLYCAMREQSANQLVLDDLNASIDEYQGDIDRLQTEEGIEDEARRRGYVTEGESGVTAVGLPEDDDEEVVEEELPWYLSLGDFVFQYHEEE